jgi:ATP-dependent exoDNAse (exonuclease V) beta subunit
MADIPDISRSVHLSASAGSGKTRALTERYIGLLDQLDRDGLGLDQAVAITFTDKAAAEIKKRVMDRLPEPMLKRIVRGRQDLRISTIHSFCMNLLKRFPLEAGLPPDFGILDDRDRTFLVRQAVELALEDLDAEPSAASLAHHSADSLIDIATALLSVRSRLKRIEIDAGGPAQMSRNLAAGLAVDSSESELPGRL